MAEHVRRLVDGVEPQVALVLPTSLKGAVRWGRACIGGVGGGLMRAPRVGGGVAVERVHVDAATDSVTAAVSDSVTAAVSDSDPAAVSDSVTAAVSCASVGIVTADSDLGL